MAHSKVFAVLERKAKESESIARYILDFLEALQIKNLSPHTVLARKKQLNRFLHWCLDRGLEVPEEVTRSNLERYQAYVFHYKKKDGHSLAVQSQKELIVSVKAFFSWLTRRDYLPHNPASEMDIPKVGNKLPKVILSTEEIETIINIPNIKTPIGIRDRAILEIFYSTGIRRQELAGLEILDMDSSRGVLVIRQAKGNKDRVVPIGDRAIAWVTKYLEEARPKLLIKADYKHLFITRFGTPLPIDYLSKMVRLYVQTSGIEKEGACHLFRHTMATAMLENGADIRYIQEILGHAKLDTTQIYTRVSIQKLKEVHTKTHPAKLSFL